jgi:1-acyl-sn-glycerol-3-phosphate acyltransferase
LKAGNCVHIYPEGTRTRTGKIGPGKPGVGRIVYETKCKVIPCYHSGLNEVLPIGRKIPRPGKKVRIIIGEAISLDHYFQRPNNLETWQAISDEIIAEIKRLKAKIE